MRNALLSIVAVGVMSSPLPAARVQPPTHSLAGRVMTGQGAEGELRTLAERRAAKIDPLVALGQE